MFSISWFLIPLGEGTSLPSSLTYLCCPVARECEVRIRIRVRVRVNRYCAINLVNEV